MAQYGKNGNGFGKLGDNNSNYNSQGAQEQRVPAYSSAYSGASYIHFIQKKN